MHDTRDVTICAYLSRNCCRTETGRTDSSRVHADSALVCIQTAAGTCAGIEPSPLQYKLRNTFSRAFIISTINCRVQHDKIAAVHTGVDRVVKNFFG